MDLRINDRHTFYPGRFVAIVCPVEQILKGLNSSPELERYTTLFISGNFSRILNGIGRMTNKICVRRPFTVHQLMTVLHENDSSIVFLEHDPTMYEDCGDVKRVVPQAMKEASRDAIFILYAPSMDKHFSYLASAADHVIVWDDGSTSNYPKKRIVQKTLTE